MCKEAENKDELKSELDFLAAMQAYRNARDSGDAEAIRAAEDAWREQVRREIIESMNVR